jgi:hypothetical protein
MAAVLGLPIREPLYRRRATSLLVSRLRVDGHEVDEGTDATIENWSVHWSTFGGNVATTEELGRMSVRKPL